MREGNGQRWSPRLGAGAVGLVRGRVHLQQLLHHGVVPLGPVAEHLLEGGVELVALPEKRGPYHQHVLKPRARGHAVEQPFGQTRLLRDEVVDVAGALLAGAGDGQGEQIDVRPKP